MNTEILLEDFRAEQSSVVSGYHNIYYRGEKIGTLLIGVTNTLGVSIPNVLFETENGTRYNTGVDLAEIVEIDSLEGGYKKLLPIVSKLYSYHLGRKDL